MVDYIFTDMSKPFSMFGESDEAYRIKGGSTALIKALVGTLENKIDMKQGHALTSLDTKEGQIVVGLQRAGRRRDHGKLRCRDSRSAIHQAAASRRLGSPAAVPGEAQDHPRARHGVEFQDHGRHHIARVAGQGYRPARAIERRLLFRFGLPKHLGDSAARSLARPGFSPTTWAAKPRKPMPRPRSTFSPQG